jgi:serine/threonine-protein kinase
MTGAERMVIAPDTRVTAVADLAPTVRRRLGDTGDGYVVTRLSSRSPSILVGPEAADFLSEFGTPRSIVSAVLDYGRAVGRDPRTVLEAVYPLLGRLVGRGFLVPADEAAPVGRSLLPGDCVDGVVVDQPVQVLDDTEVHRARTAAGEAVALKLARPGAPPDVDGMLRREAETLRRLNGAQAPCLRATGMRDGRPYVVSSWRPGIDAGEAAMIARLREGPAGRPAREMTLAVIEAYARLHEAGVLHGDVHARNVLVDGERTVTLVDFGLADAIAGDMPGMPPPRRGVGFSFEPEYARTRRLGLAPVGLTPAGEQYAVATLAYLLLTGAPYADLALDDELWRQIEVAPPLPFARRGAPGWPAGETVLARALSKDPAARFPSTRDFADAFRAACRDRCRPPIVRPPAAARALVDAVLGRLDTDPATVALPDPAWTAHSGAAGIALLFHRAACVRDDPALLARADTWAQRAVDEAATRTVRGERTPATAVGPGPGSVHHAPAGAFLVRALVSLAQGDHESADHALTAFCDHAREPSPAVDVVFGTAGALLACASLLDATAALPPLRRRVLELGDALHRSLADAPPAGWLGIAHGSAGLLYASLSWTQATGHPTDAGLEAGLDALRSDATVARHGAWWPRRLGPPDPASPPATGWCHGSAGHAHLWCLASGATKRSEDLELAERAALHAADGPTRPGGSLCCGWSGQAYACLALARATGESVWRRRARRLADRAAGWALGRSLPPSLYAGDVGVALLMADMEDADNARMPLFEPDA